MEVLLEVLEVLEVLKIQKKVTEKLNRKQASNTVVWKMIFCSNYDKNIYPSRLKLQHLV